MDPREVIEGEIAAMDAPRYIKRADERMEEAVGLLRIARDNMDRDNPKARDLSIAITHVEDALLRLRA